MPWVICFLVGIIVGGGGVFALLMDRHRRVMKRGAELAGESAKLATAVVAHKTRVEEFDAAHKAQAAALEAQQRIRSVELESAYSARSSELEERDRELAQQEEHFKSRIISYDELRNENAIIKRDLQNVDVSLHKSQLDHELHDQKQRVLAERSDELCRRYLKETVKLVGRSLTPNNFAASKERLLDVIEHCREIGFEVTGEQIAQYVTELRSEYELVVKAALEREEQAKIKAQIREEEKLKREIEREKEQVERERLVVQAALDQALAEAQDRHSEEVDVLKARLAEAESKQRALSMAQQTRAGNVYVISNVGAFGKDVFKIGMTRRLEPLDRIRELGDASVPFPFDVHMVISCHDAPALENAIHHALHKKRLNRVNPRKEYFRTDIDTIVHVIREHRGCEVEYVADAEAMEYNQSLSMSEEDADYIESVFEAVEDERDAVVED